MPAAALDARTGLARVGIVADEARASGGIGEAATQRVADVGSAAWAAIPCPARQAAARSEPACPVGRRPRVAARAGVAALDALLRVEQEPGVSPHRETGEIHQSQHGWSAAPHGWQLPFVMSQPSPWWQCSVFTSPSGPQQRLPGVSQRRQ